MDKLKDALIASGIAAFITFLHVLAEYLAGIETQQIEAAASGVTGSLLYVLKHVARVV